MPEFDHALIISDLHLTAAYPFTANRFIDFCKNEARQVQAVFIIGDLFEFWVGDDAHMHTPFNLSIGKEIQALSASGVQVFFIAGNRDFMLGKDFQNITSWTVLPDPSVVNIGGQSWLLSHGDMLCTADPAYQLFRSFTRVPFFQYLFMLIPPKLRQKMGDRLRSRAAMKYQRREYFDPMTANIKGNVTLEACAKITDKFKCPRLIHGHTHRPGAQEEQFGNQSWTRWVLSDWDLDHPEMKPRANALLINSSGITAIDLMQTSSLG